MRSAVLSVAVAVAVSSIVRGGLAGAQPWHLPWRAGQAVYVTQDCNDSCCNDHVGHNAYAWDFAAHGPFEVVAPRAGTLVHVKMSSNRGGDASEVDAANYIVIDHGDGTASVMLHLAHGSLDPAVRCGDFVRAGQRLAVTGSTGWSSGIHLHYQVNRIPPWMSRVCECGPDGMACGENESHWELFWSHQEASATIPVRFEEWPTASVCGDRHDDNVLVSRNVDAHEELIVIDEAEPRRFVPLLGAWSMAPGGMRGSYRQASVGRAAAMVSFEGRVPRPGVYEIWHAIPVSGRTTGVAAAQVEIIASGGRVTTVQAQNVPGGGYHPLPGRYKLTGRPGEGVILSADGRPGEALAVDTVLLRRVADAGSQTEGATCSASSECRGALVCAGGQCRAGCEVTGCDDGTLCDGTGLCVPRSSANTSMATGSTMTSVRRGRSAMVPGERAPNGITDGARETGPPRGSSFEWATLQSDVLLRRLLGVLGGVMSVLFGLWAVNARALVQHGRCQDTCDGCASVHRGTSRTDFWGGSHTGH